MPRIPGTTPYSWPWNGETDPASMGVVICGSDVEWRGRCAGVEAVQVRIKALADAIRSAGGVVVWVSHGARPLDLGPPDDPAVECAGVDGFYGSRLDATLRRRGVGSLLMAGFGLEGPVHSTLRSANDRGYECLLVADACAALDDNLRAAALSTVEMSGGIFGAVGHLDPVVDFYRTHHQGALHVR